MSTSVYEMYCVLIITTLNLMMMIIMSDLVMLQGILGASFTLVQSNQTIQTCVDGMALIVFIISIYTANFYFSFCAAHLPVRLDKETKFPYCFF